MPGSHFSPLKMTSQACLSGTSTANVVARQSETHRCFVLSELTVPWKLPPWLGRTENQRNIKTESLKNFIISVWSQKDKSMPGNRNLEKKRVKEKVREGKERGGVYSKPYHTTLHTGHELLSFKTKVKVSA